MFSRNLLPRQMSESSDFFSSAAFAGEDGTVRFVTTSAPRGVLIVFK